MRPDPFALSPTVLVMTRPEAILYSEPDPAETLQLIMSTVELPGDTCVRLVGGNGWIDLQIPLPFNVLMVSTGMRWSQNSLDKVVALSDLAECFIDNKEIEKIESHPRTPDFPNLPESDWWESELSSGYVIGTIEEVKRTVISRMHSSSTNFSFYDERFIKEVATMAAMGINRPGGILIVPAVLLIVSDLLDLPDRVESVGLLSHGPWIGLRFGSTTLYALASDSHWTVNSVDPEDLFS